MTGAAFAACSLAATVSAGVSWLLVARQSLVCIVDVPNQRSSHTVPKPRTGGVAVLLALVVGGTLLWASGGAVLPGSLNRGWLIGGALTFFGLGFLDDAVHLPEKLRLAAQALFSLVVAIKGPRLQAIDLLGLHALLPGYISVVLTAFWYTGFVNLFNFMDGIDGIAASEAALVGLFLALTTHSAGPLLMSAAALGFLTFNWQPAKIFLGDGGSYLLGFLLAAFSVAGAASAPFAVFVLFLGTFIADTAITLIRRMLKREDWLRAHRSHYYQKLTTLGLSHWQVSALNLAGTALLGLTGLAYAGLSPLPQALLLAGWAAACALAIFGIHRLEARRQSGKSSQVAASLTTLALLLTIACRPGNAAGLASGFPIGIYGVDDPHYMRELRDAGFNMIQTYGTDFKTLSTLAAASKKLGMRMVVGPDEVRKGPKSQTAGWPIAAWYLKDEPEGWHMPPAVLQRISEETRQWDPATPQTFVIGIGSAARNYGKIADILMLDWYPVPHLKIDSVADQIDTARRWLAPNKPLWFVVQAFDWSEIRQRDPKKPRIGRFPDFREVRFMSYLAIAHGAAGLFYYTLKKPNGKPLVAYPEQYQAVARVVREIKFLQPVLATGASIAVPFGPLTQGVEARAWRFDHRDYVLLINRTASELPVPAGARDHRWRPLFEPHRDVDRLLENGLLQPHRALVLEGGS